jgi:hypothetical protein
MYVEDIDKNGSIDQVLSIARNGNYYPFLNKENLESRLPYLRKEFLTYSTMAGKSTEEVFKDKLQRGKLFMASCFSSCVLLNMGNGKFSVQSLPDRLQWSSVFSFYVDDFNDDGRMDLFAGGNFYGVNPYEGRYDALLPDIYLGNGKGSFKVMQPVPEDLLEIDGEVRDIKPIRIGNRKILIVARNNKPLVFLKISNS